MRILFLCGSLEPAKDGVGDYVRSLADACLELGHDCRVIALNDPYVTEPVEASEPVGESKLTLLRLPQSLSWIKRTRLAIAFRDQFQPDWISLQLVSYGMNEKGLIGKLVPHFKDILSGARVHIMFHELWVGMPVAAPFKHTLVGAWQRHGIRRLCNTIKPQLVTTSNPLYVEALKRIGVSAKLLPLYGNIPIVDRGPHPEFPGWLGDLGINAVNRHEWWLGLFFGGLYAEWQPEPFMTRLRHAAVSAHKKSVFCLSVDPVPSGKGYGRDLQSAYPDVSLPVMGQQPAEVVSIIMQIADFGVAASPWDLIGKSGSATAMIEHGLPVIVTREDLQSRFKVSERPSDDPLFHLCDEGLESKLILGLPKRAPHPGRHQRAAELCGMLESAS